MSTGVSVSYTYTPNTALVGILVESNGSGLEFSPAVPALSPGQWTVTFQLLAGEGITELKFDEENGVVIDVAPPLLRVISSQFVDDTHWQTVFTNTVDSSNQAEYTLNGTANGEVFVASGGGPTRFSHDPTIAVTTDPIGG
jgi:hypothetical protein